MPFASSQTLKQGPVKSCIQAHVYLLLSLCHSASDCVQLPLLRISAIIGFLISSWKLEGCFPLWLYWWAFETYLLWFSTPQMFYHTWPRWHRMFNSSNTQLKSILNQLNTPRFTLSFAKYFFSLVGLVRFQHEEWDCLGLGKKYSGEPIREKVGTGHAFTTSSGKGPPPSADIKGSF